jgi:hypothetical protein
MALMIVYPLYVAYILIVMSNSDKFVDNCPSIKPGDERYKTVQMLVSKTGCSEVNEKLSDCLNATRKDWSKCKVWFG